MLTSVHGPFVAVETIQANLSRFIDLPPPSPSLSSDEPNLERRQSNMSMLSQVSGRIDFAVASITAGEGGFIIYFHPCPGVWHFSIHNEGHRSNIIINSMDSIALYDTVVTAVLIGCCSDITVVGKQEAGLCPVLPGCPPVIPPHCTSLPPSCQLLGVD